MDKAFTIESRVFMTLPIEAFQTMVGKGENDGYQHFLFVPTIFSNTFFLGVLPILSKDKFQYLCHLKFCICKYFQFGRP